MTSPPTPSLAVAREALAEAAPRLTALIRSIREPNAHAVGEWSAADVALHLAHAWETLPSLSRSEMASPLNEVAELAGLTTALVAGEADRDLEAIAARIDASAVAFLADCSPGAPSAEAPWLVEGVQFHRAVVACHLLNETLVHGHDIAASQGVAWRISADHAGLVITGFILPVLSALDPRAMVDQAAAAGLRAAFDVSLRGHGRAVLAFDDGAVTVEPPSSRRVDCHISADAASFLMVLWGRQSQWSAIARGRLLAWGRRPWLAPRMRSVMRNP